MSLTLQVGILHSFKKKTHVRNFSTRNSGARHGWANFMGARQFLWAWGVFRFMLDAISRLLLRSLCAGKQTENNPNVLNRCIADAHPSGAHSDVI